MKMFLVGGAVRDTYLKRAVSDEDYVVVGATPQEMLDMGFEQVGAAFPVFLHPVTGDEYALARKERKSGPGYHGFEVDFDPNVTLEEDLYRRDFTINAMAIDMDTADLIDPYGGFADLKNRTLRHVGPAFSEDPLRVIRMARFLAKLREDGFTVADETFFLAHQLVQQGALNELAPERLAAEVQKVLNTCSPDGCFTFFDVLSKLDCSRNVSFFKDVDLMRAARLAKAVRAQATDGVRAEMLAPLIFKDGRRRELLGGAVARSIGAALDRLEGKVLSTSMLYELLKVMGAWNNSPTWTMTLSAVRLLQHTGEADLPVSFGLLMAAEAMTTPCANLGARLAIDGLPGSEIGKAIKDARMQALTALDLE